MVIRGLDLFGSWFFEFSNMILIIEHVEVEGPGTIVAYLKKRKIPYQTIALYRGDSFPHALSEVDAVICMGGPISRNLFRIAVVGESRWRKGCQIAC